MKPSAIFVAGIAVCVFVLDQLTKMMVVQNIGMGNVWYPIPAFEFLRIVGSYNTGTACGYFPQLSMLFTVAPFFILAVVVWFYRSQKKPSWLLSIGIGLIIGGAVGNLVNRLQLGYVIDFVQVGTFPIFNVADASVSTAVVLMLLWSLREDTAHAKPADAASDAVPVTPNASWKLGAIFLGVLGVVAVLAYFVCVFVPENFLR
ncbi:MAG: signal peptidase II [Chloroflexi bacterium]|nr:signal peptidase II [Chloroflexota bacterium]